MFAYLLMGFVVIAALVFMNTRNKKYAVPPLGCGALPIIGHVFSLLVNHEKLHRAMVETIGYDAVKRGLDAVTIKLGTCLVYVILDPDDALTVSNTCLNKDKFYKFFQPLFGKEGLVTADEIIWKRHRKLLNPTFNQKVLDDFLIEINSCSRRLVQDLSRYVGKGFFDHHDLISQFTMNMICATAMGASMDEEDARHKEIYVKCMEGYSTGIIDRFQKFWLHNDFIYGFSALKKKQDHLGKTMNELSDMVIHKRRKLRETSRKFENASSKPKYPVFLDLLLDLADEGALTDSEIREEVNTFITAGSDTTAVALAYTMLAVGSYSHVQQKVFDELDAVFGDSDRDVEKQDLSQLKYTEAVIKETLRLYPLILNIGRTIHKDVVLKNYTLPAGRVCYIALCCVLRHKSWGEDAHEFKPERWLEPGRLPASHAFAAFGVGKRSCIGSNFAMMSMKTTLAHLMRHFRFQGDVTKLVQKMDIVVKPVSGCSIKVERRHLKRTIN